MEQHSQGRYRPTAKTYRTQKLPQRIAPLKDYRLGQYQYLQWSRTNHTITRSTDQHIYLSLASDRTPITLELIPLLVTPRDFQTTPRLITKVFPPHILDQTFHLLEGIIGQMDGHIIHYLIHTNLITIINWMQLTTA